MYRSIVFRLFFINSCMTTCYGRLSMYWVHVHKYNVCFTRINVTTKELQLYEKLRTFTYPVILLKLFALIYVFFRLGYKQGKGRSLVRDK